MVKIQFTFRPWSPTSPGTPSGPYENNKYMNVKEKEEKEEIIKVTIKTKFSKIMIITVIKNSHSRIIFNIHT